MRDTALEAILRRDRVVVVVALVVVAVLAWTYLAYLGLQMSSQSKTDAGMSDIDMPGMDMGGSGEASDFRPWALADFAFIFIMWAVMMVGMMTPSIAPMVLLYAAVGRKARTDGKPFPATGWFFAGYALVWVLFSILATVCQLVLASMTVLTPGMSIANSKVGGLVLIAAGIYQWTPVKDVCLRQCQSPIAFLASHGGFRADGRGALKLGAKHGAYCIGCCWALMALLFVGGVMNVAWIGFIAILILLEKTLPVGRLIARLSGTLLVLTGIWLSAAG